MKNKNSPSCLLLFFIYLLFSCQKVELSTLQGNSMGTYYTIIYVGEENLSLKKSIDSLLDDVSLQISIFDTTSLISKINRGENLLLSPEFITIFNKAQEISSKTGGAFDATVAPLVTLWGFGSEKMNAITPHALDSIRQFIGFEKVRIENQYLIKDDPRIALNFNAIAKGYGVDKVSEFLFSKGYVNHVVEIGGEVKVQGKKGKNPWQIGIQIPTDKRDGAIESNYTFTLYNRAVATSGNYRNYYEMDTIRYSHIINPHTGMAEYSDVLSVTVIADDCMSADAYATAFMVMGVEPSISFLKNEKELAAYFVYRNRKNKKIETFATDNFPDAVK